MQVRILILSALLLPATTLADEAMMPPSVWETCSPGGDYCARLDPADDSMVAYKAGVAQKVLWTATGWSRVAALADDGEHLVLGYEGMNLIPLDYRSDMPMLTFYRGGEIIGTVRLRDMISDTAIRMNRTVPSYNWGDYLGLGADGRYRVRTATGREIRFDMTTGKLVRQRIRRMPVIRR